MFDRMTDPPPASPPMSASPPKANGVPLLGVLPYLASQPLAYLHQARERHGDLFYAKVGPMQLLVANHPRHAEHVLSRRNTVYAKGGPLWEVLRPYLGNGLLMSEGDYWLRQRRLMQPLFTQQRLVALSDLMLEAIDAGLEHWREPAERALPFDVDRAFSKLTMMISARVIFGRGMSAQEAQVLGSHVTHVIDSMVGNMLTKSIPSWVPLPGRRRYQQALKDVDEGLLRLIQRSGASDETADNDGLLASFIRARTSQVAEPLTAKELRDETMTLFLGGHQTTAYALTWSIYFLTLYPQVEQRMRAEVEALGGRRPTFSDLAALPYMRMVIQESMRARPPVWWIPRKALEDDEIDGHHIPAGTVVAPIMFTIHHHPEIWESPMEFDPERFTPERSANRHRFAWVPFGSGPRKCIGEHFSMMESQLALARIVQKFRFKGVPGRQVTPTLLTTLGTKDGVFVQLIPNE
ncbi:cytochrome P450 [Melittangium boletus]|uniref:Cytochrome n=1 Tax=Melittangium boletus DSM 14713 TaxID=1294270 RepID=A0A250I975_9BACT|nr:cytochrome P450 [Melittangium boletus]ATB27516.1 cytochrome [Melittangium boletus DSM 14713]